MLAILIDWYWCIYRTEYIIIMIRNFVLRIWPFKIVSYVPPNVYYFRRIRYILLQDRNKVCIAGGLLSPCSAYYFHFSELIYQFCCMLIRCWQLAWKLLTHCYIPVFSCYRFGNTSTFSYDPRETERSDNYWC